MLQKLDFVTGKDSAGVGAFGSSRSGGLVSMRGRSRLCWGDYFAHDGKRAEAVLVGRRLGEPS